MFTYVVCTQEMQYVYILKSLSNENWHYVGMTSNIKDRLKRHNSGRVKSTKPYRPFKLIYTIQFDNSEKAREYEKYIKISSNKEKLIKSLS